MSALRARLRKKYSFNPISPARIEHVHVCVCVCVRVCVWVHLRVYASAANMELKEWGEMGLCNVWSRIKKSFRSIFRKSTTLEAHTDKWSMCFSFKDRVII